MSILIRPRVAIRYQKSIGDIPFDLWLKKLKDIATKAKIVTRVERAERGLFGDYKAIDADVKELRIDFGPGYRVYFAIHKDKLILLLIGGDKSTQTNDMDCGR